MRRFAILAVLGVCCSLIPAAADEEPLQGFTRESSAVERQWEAKFRAIPSPQDQREYMQRLSARPHNVGTAYDKENAEWILAQYKQWGWDAHIERFDALYPTPKERVLEMVAPTKFVAKLQEPPVAGDPTSSQQSEQLPSYNAYSIDGDVTAPLVYVNYGVPADYDELDRLGISVKGSIVIARYGGSWRGIKPKVAAEHGAIGCLIYSDPHEDGYFVDNVFPKGPMRQRDGFSVGAAGRSADSGSGRNSGCEAHTHQGQPRAHEDTDSSDFVRRRAAVARGSRWPDGAGGMARFASDFVSRGPGRSASAPESGI
jgi:N-acetylated-alpha-linked acidic dipeptidase